MMASIVTMQNDLVRAMMRSLSVKIINVENRNDRRIECAKELDGAGLTSAEYSFFNAKYLPDFGARGCALSHARAISDFLFEEEKPYLLVFEDDFSIKESESFLALIQEALDYKHLWDVLLLAHNCAVPIAATPLTRIKRVVNSQTASGYIVGRLYAAKLVECFFRSSELLARSEKLSSPDREFAAGIFCCDMLWKDLQINDVFWAYLPSLTLQRASYSDIEKTVVDYKA